MMQQIAAGCALLMGTVAVAQNSAEMQDIEPRWVATNAPAVPIKSGNLVQLYAVGELPAGTVLMQDGVSDEWARVVYPGNVYPFIRAADARDLGNDRVVLTAASQLLAPNRQIGLAGSWRSVYRTALPAGTEFEIMGRETDTDGEVTAYAVRPFVGETIGTRPHGFVRAGSLRAATEAEVQAVLARQNAANTEPATPVANDEPAEQVNPVIPADVDDTLLNPINTEPATTPPVDDEVANNAPVETDAIDADVETAETENASADEPVEIDSSAVGQVEEDSLTDEYGIRPAKLKELEATFEAARQLSREELDAALEELIAEYGRALEVAEEASVQAALQSRLDWLNLRKATRDQRQSIRAFLSESQDVNTENMEKADRWRSSRSFDLSGRVLVSRVYDGRRLPKMYRLVAEDPINGPETVGYIPESDAFDPGLFVGRIVGIRGTRERDVASGLRVIRVVSAEAMPE